jgi:hypothetical protein
MLWRRASMMITDLLLLGGLILPVASCGQGSSGGGGTQYDYGVSLTPAKSTVAPGETVNLNLHYDAPATNAGLTWSLSCTQADCGSVTAAGMYTGPATVTAQMVVGIRATSKDRPTSSYYIELWVTGPIHVLLSPDWAVTLVTGTTQQFSATVNSPDTAMIWQVNGSVGGNSTVGTISTAGLYTAPAHVPNPDTVTVTAVAHADQTASASKQVTITPPPAVVVSIAPRDRTVATGATLQFTATVQNTSDLAVQWQVNGVTGGNSTVGTISTTGLFTAPIAVPSPAQETITAISHADPARSDSTFVTISGSNNARLSGSYAFLFNGPGYLNGVTSPMVGMIGALVADGNGNVTGMLDYNSMLVSSSTAAQTFTGTYNIGADDRGLMVFNLPFPATYAFTINAAGTNAKLVEFDASTGRQAGFLEKQTATDFSVTKLTGDYVFAVYGSAAGQNRSTAVGRFHADGSGALSAASLDVKPSTGNLISLSNLIGTAALANSTYGRGTLTLVESSTESINASFYMVNAGELLVMTTDEVTSDDPLLVGRILSQTGGPFSDSSLSGAGVFSLAGVPTNNPIGTYLTVGQWSAGGSTQTLSGIFDQIANGTPLTNQAFTASYTIASSGRGTFTSSALPQMVIYMIAPNRAFLMQSSNYEEQIGMVEPQQAATFDNSYFTGTYRIGPISMPQFGSSVSQGNLVAGGSGVFTATEDVNDQGLSQQTFSGTYSVASSGRTEITVTSPASFHYVAYPVSPVRFIGLSIEPNDYAALLAALDR